MPLTDKCLNWHVLLYKLIMKRFSILSFLTICSCLFYCCSNPPEEDKHSPTNSLSDLKVHDGLEVTLFASEPMFSNPTNMDIDAKGRVWICEAYNYRNQYNPKNPVRPEGDRIMILEDTDGDGKADTHEVVLTGWQQLHCRSRTSDLPREQLNPMMVRPRSAPFRMRGSSSWITVPWCPCSPQVPSRWARAPTRL